MLKVAVIGGSGFIGTRLMRRLVAASNISPLIVDKIKSHEFPEACSCADVRNLDDLRKAISPEMVLINLAAEHRDDVRPASLYHDVNVLGAINICRIAREKDIKVIVFTSSVAVYGFAPIGIDESGEIDPFNDYGRTKYEAEQVYRTWQSEAPDSRTLVIIRPTVVFGEDNRGNVFNLLRQIVSGRFMMIGGGNNKKSLAYVENVASFIEYSINFDAGVHLYNFIDKPDFSMNQLVAFVKKVTGRPEGIGVRLPFFVGLLIGKVFDVVSSVTGISFAVSSIRIKKFCSDSVYESSVEDTGFISPVALNAALEKTITYEFIEKRGDRRLFYSE